VADQHSAPAGDVLARAEVSVHPYAYLFLKMHDTEVAQKWQGDQNISKVPQDSQRNVRAAP